MDQGVYTTSFVPAGALDDATKRRMASIYLAIYDGSSEALFLHDLAQKDEVLLVHAAGELVGFTTVRMFEREWQGDTVGVVYSGDTVVERAHWGQQALAFAWIERMGRLKAEWPQRPLWSIERSDLRRLADALALEMFPHDYNPRTGVVEFAESRGHLKGDIAVPSADDLRREGVRFFLERNPGFRRGHELVCLCEIEEHNMKPLTKALFQKGARALA
jgi:hypothetical protein